MGQRLDEAPIVGRLGACLAAILFIAGSSAQAMAQQHYLCFFDRSSHEISQRCSQIMEEFVRAYARAFGPLDDPNVV